MKVTDCFPIFYANDAEAETKRFTELLGYSVKHRPKIEFLDYLVLENDKKRRVDIVSSHFPADSFKEGFFGMRVNVDDFDEGAAFFRARGYEVFGEVHETQTFSVALLKNRDGACLVLFCHKDKR